jgi:predicted HicB family RNase H-like nuclease
MSRYPLDLPNDLYREAAAWAERQGISLNQFILWSVTEKVGELRRGLDDP